MVFQVVGALRNSMLDVWPCIRPSMNSCLCIASYCFFCRSSSSSIWCSSNNSRSWSWSSSHIFFFLFFPEMTWDEVCFPQGQGAAARFDLMWLDSVSSCLSVCIAGSVGRSSILHAAAATATWGPSSILHPLRPPQLPPPEEHLLLVRLPGRPHPQV